MTYTIRITTIITAPTEQEAKELCSVHERYGNCGDVDWVEVTGDCVEREDGYDTTVHYALEYPPEGMKCIGHD